MNDSPQSKGGNARAANLSPERRQEIARKAVAARWAKPREPKAKKHTVQEPWLHDFLKGVIGVVEATSCEDFYLWKEYKQERGVSWVQQNPGYGITVGRLGNRPVCISLRIIVVDGHRLLFYDATSQVVDHVMVRKWLDDNLPESARDKERGGYLNHVDAMNFHNVFPRKPRPAVVMPILIPKAGIIV